MRIPTAPGRNAGLVGRGVAVALALACLALPTRAPAAPEAPPAADSVAARHAAALRLHEERRHAEAAALLEQLFAETGRSDLLFDAGQARFAAGHRAHALRLWQAYADAPGRSADDIALAARRIADARALTTPIALRVRVPAADTSATATLRRRDDPPDQARPPIVLSNMPHGTGHDAHVLKDSIFLDPGTWELSVTAPELPVVWRGIRVHREPQTVEVTLPSPRGVPSRRARTGLSVGLLTTATLAALPGGVLAGWRARQLDGVTASCRVYGPEAPLCNEGAILGHIREAGLGSGLAGAGVGLAVAGITAAFPARRPVWYVELMAGGVALVVGASWLGASTAAYAPAEFDAYLDRLQPWFRGRAVAAALLGAGLGLSAGAATGLLVWRRRPVKLRAAFAPTGLGLVGSF